MDKFISFIKGIIVIDDLNLVLLSYNYMKMGLPNVATDVEVKGVLDSGHYMFEEAPERIIDITIQFLSTSTA